MFNSPITITGRIAEDPAYYMNKDKTDGVLRLRIASSRSFLKDQQWKNVDQLYITVEAWGRLGVNAHQTLLKGTAVIIQGMLYTNSWKAPAPAGETGEQPGENNEVSRQEIRLRASSIGVDMNYYKVGFKDARPILESNLHQIEIPGGNGEFYPDLSKRAPAAKTPDTPDTASQDSPDPSTGPEQSGGGNQESGEAGQDGRELVGVTAQAGETDPPF